jgi:hypothetical protein
MSTTSMRPEINRQNATRHGFTGQTLILSPEEKEAYETHCIAYIDQYSPSSHEETDLVQQYADLRWTLHQISVQQSNTLSIINAITTKLMKNGDFEALTAATAQLFKTLNTLAIYEQRRRRAAEATLERLNMLTAARRHAVTQAAPIYKLHKAQDKPFIPSDFGFVCSLAEIERYILRESAVQASKTAKVPVA